MFDSGNQIVDRIGSFVRARHCLPGSQHFHPGEASHEPQYPDHRGCDDQVGR